MGTEELRAAVLQEATAQADALVQAATVQASQAVEDEQRRLEEHANVRAADYQAVQLRTAATKAATSRIELRNAVLKRKQELLEDLYREVERTVADTDSLYQKYLEHAAMHIGNETPVSIECRNDDVSAVTAILSRRSDASGIRIEPVLPEDKRGLVVRFADAVIDLTLSAACVSLREDTIVETAQALFSQKK